MNDANARIFERSLRAVETVASNSLSFVLLQIGLGVYGGLRSPMPWREDRCAGPNPRWNKAFYTPQMAFLKSFEKGKRWEGNWTITAPSLIFGATTGAYMNVSTTLGILVSCIWSYPWFPPLNRFRQACIKSVLGEPFQFPGAKGAYEAFQDGSDVALVAKFNVWAMSEPKCRGEMFNIVNGDLFNWENIWPILAEEFGAVVPKDQCGCLARLMAR